MGNRETLRRHWPLLLVLVLAGALRVGLTLEHASSPLWNFLRLDEAQYAQTALEAAGGAILPGYVRTNAPGYAWFLAPLFALFHDPIPPARVVQMLLGLGSVALAYFLALRLSASRVAATAAALLLGLYWPLLIFEQHLLSGSLLVFLNLAGLTLALRATTGNPQRMKPIFAAGLVFGLAALVVPTTLAAALFVAAALALAPGLARRARLARAAIFFSVVLLPVLTVMTVDRARSGEWFLLQTNGGLNFYIGNGPESDGTPWARPGGDWDALVSMPAREGVMTDAEQDRWFTRWALAAAAEDPGRFARLLVRKATLSLSNREVYATIFPEFHRELFAATRLPLPGFGIILALAFASIPALWKRPGAFVLLLYCLGWWLALTLTVVSSRYRLPLTAGLCVAAGVGTPAFLRAFAERAAAGRLTIETDRLSVWTWFAAVLGVAIAAVTFSFSLPLERKMNSEEWAMLAEADLNQNDIHAGIDHARAAISVGPQNSLAWLQLARAAMMDRQPQVALEFMGSAVAADPRCSEAHYQLAYALKAAGDLPGALREARAAVDATPQRVTVLMGWAELAIAAGQTDEARAALARVYKMRPDFEPARKLEQQLGGTAGPGGAP